MFTHTNKCTSFSAATVEHAQLEAVYIFFDTATYNEIERDVKVAKKHISLLRVCKAKANINSGDN